MSSKISNAISLLSVFMLVILQTTSGQETKAIEGIFEGEEIIDVSLHFDVDRFMREKSDQEYMDALMTFFSGRDDSVSYDIKLRARGNSRRKICDFPPIRLNFKDVETVFGDLDDMSNVKMVTHCDQAKSFEDYVLKEYLVYKLFNVVSEYSYRVRLLKVRFIDTSEKQRNFHKYAFLIEPMDLLEERLEVFEIESVILTYEDLIPELLDRMTLFQFMIGNTDFQLATYHNIKVVKRADELKGVAIPYDFDYSGFVDTHYSVPGENQEEMINVRQRKYMGACRSNSSYEQMLTEFLEHQADFYRIIEEFELLSEPAARYIKGYLDGFYDMFENNRIKRSLKRSCVKQKE